MLQETQAAYTPKAALQWSEEVSKYNFQKNWKHNPQRKYLDLKIYLTPLWAYQQDDKVSPKSVGGREF